jgi:hypothetical protein
MAIISGPWSLLAKPGMLAATDVVEGGRHLANNCPKAAMMTHPKGKLLA